MSMARLSKPSAVAPIGVSSQHERLILELLPFKESSEFHEWLSSEYVRNSWEEFKRDFLSQNPNAAEPDKTRTSKEAKDAVDSKTPKFCLYHPDKSDWTEQDHHVRFMVQVIRDNMLGKSGRLWSKSDWARRGIDIAKATYEVLSFLRTAQYTADPNPPSYEA